MSRLMVCHYCKKPFGAERSDAKFCSDSCRVSYSRLPSTMRRKSGQSWGYLKEIAALAEKYPEKVNEAAAELAAVRELLIQLERNVAKLRDLPESKKP